MTHAEAEHDCAERNAGEDAPGVRWLVREAAPGDWRPVRAVIPGIRARGPMRTVIESRPRPEAPDPRPPVNPNWGAPGF